MSFRRTSGGDPAWTGPASGNRLSRAATSSTAGARLWIHSVRSCSANHESWARKSRLNAACRRTRAKLTCDGRADARRESYFDQNLDEPAL